MSIDVNVCISKMVLMLVKVGVHTYVTHTQLFSPDFYRLENKN